MALSPGTRLGPYEILSALGAGGMGEVYRARDTQLRRDVALKVLPDAFAHDPDRLSRFRREAELLATLNHPNIAAVYHLAQADDVTAIVLELVEGETLADRIEVQGGKGTGLPIGDALRMGRQIAEALEAAHEKGVIHRDLKPANIKIAPDGTVKVLDFGLAKALDQDLKTSRLQDLADTATRTTPAITQAGTILGTAGYMSPEQARGLAVDRRTDIWAFGCVLFEMLSGRRAFGGTTWSDAIAAILEREPEWTRLRAATPPSIERLLRRCLDKDPKRRLHDIADARIELEDALGPPARATVTAGIEGHGRARRVPRAALGWSLGVIVLAAIGGAFWTRAPSRALTGLRPVTRAVIELPPGTQLSASASVVISPDGRSVIFAADADGTSQLYRRAMDRLTADPIPGTEGASHPFMSPDGQWVAFQIGYQIKKVALSGGAAQVICDGVGIVNFAAWGADGTILVTPDAGDGLWRVSASGGTPQMLTKPSRDQREKTHRGPEVLPGGKAALMTVGTGDITSFDDARIEVLTLATGARRVLVQGGMNARYVSTGHLVYARAGSLLAVPFDLNRLEVTGRPITVVEDVFTSPDWGYADFAVSPEGSLLYAPGAGTGPKAALVWVDRQGQTEPAAEIRAPFGQLQLSPDGSLIAVWRDGANSEILIYDFVRTTFMRLVHGMDNVMAIWSPDGTRVTFSSNRATPRRDMFWQAADGTGAAEQLTEHPPTDQFPQSWSPDGRFLVFNQNGDLWVWSAEDRTSRPLLQTPAEEAEARISPDGHWMAYTSNQSGRNEVYVQAFPGPSRTWQVSLEGGTSPIWARSGRELFFRKDNQVLAADVSTTHDFSAGRPKRLFEGVYVQGDLSYDVAPDGRFLMIKDDPKQVTRLNLVQNWVEELKAKVPTP